MEEERERLREMLSGEKGAGATAGDVAYTPPGLPSKVCRLHFDTVKHQCISAWCRTFEWSISRFRTQLQNVPLESLWATTFLPPEIFPMLRHVCDSIINMSLLALAHTTGVGWPKGDGERR